MKCLVVVFCDNTSLLVTCNACVSDDYLVFLNLSVFHCFISLFSGTATCDNDSLYFEENNKLNCTCVTDHKTTAHSTLCGILQDFSAQMWAGFDSGKCLAPFGARYWVYRAESSIWQRLWRDEKLFFSIWKDELFSKWSSCPNYYCIVTGWLSPTIWLHEISTNNISSLDPITAALSPSYKAYTKLWFHLVS